MNFCIRLQATKYVVFRIISAPRIMRFFSFKSNISFQLNYVLYVYYVCPGNTSQSPIIPRFMRKQFTYNSGTIFKAQIAVNIANSLTIHIQIFPSIRTIKQHSDWRFSSVFRAFLEPHSTHSSSMLCARPNSSRIAAVKQKLRRPSQLATRIVLF